MSFGPFFVVESYFAAAEVSFFIVLSFEHFSYFVVAFVGAVGGSAFFAVEPCSIGL
jgi:hypothetical protein